MSKPFTSVRYAVLGMFIAMVALAMIVQPSGAKENPMVIMETSKGTITIELYADKSPVSVENFLWYVDNNFYDGLVFHRVIPNFMIQGGGFTKDMTKKKTNPPIKNEANNGAKNMRGTLAMARTQDINSATAQFFINLKNNDFLNYQSPSQYGYAVFGKVVEGMDVVDAIAAVKTVTKGQYNDVPSTSITIEKAYRMEAASKKEMEKKED
jgi:cyclophilin family peptidyl-prolyl cis-trans isomerase